MELCSIIIPTRLRAGLLSETLDTLHRQTDKNFEVVVVCDGEDPATRELASRFTAEYPLRWVFNEFHQGLAAARNSGALAACGDWLIFLDDDVTPADDWLAQHRKHQSEWIPQCDFVVSGKIVETYSSLPRSSSEMILRTLRDRYMTAMEKEFQIMSADFEAWVWLGDNGSIRKNTFLATGGFDPNIQFHDEDFEFAFRLRNRGVRFYFEPGAIVYHRSTKNLVAISREIYRLSGKRQVYRVREKGQRNAQVAGLTSMYGKGGAYYIFNRLAWEYPHAFEKAAEACRQAVDATNSELLFRLWLRLNKYLFWQGAREERATLDWLREIVRCRVPVLNFHSIASPPRPDMNHYHLSPHRFRRFLDWLRIAHYQTILPGDWMNGNVPDRNVVLTFDDGYEDFLSEAFPLLSEFKMKATVFVVAGRLGQSNQWVEPLGHPVRRLLSKEQIRLLHRHGVQFGSHTMTHPYLTKASDDVLRREVTDSKRLLEDLLGVEISCFAYPYGDLNERVRAAVAEAGFRVAMSTQEGINLWNDPLWMRRTNVNDTDSILEFAFKTAMGRDLRQGMKRKMSRLRKQLSFGVS
ncbi:MAG: hypothetical protein A3F68_02265 [Acidobacteria bacterium RIFCSPLOWO2_12_FULL_54_10]|nr:MAG: hypothetical protein A3F68_02265 [Acidobacteria bacterium RIFCSPLOWO2_12_FULL_54_10]